MSRVDTTDATHAEATWADDGGHSKREELQESVAERRSRTSARGVTEWETAFAAAREQRAAARLAQATDIAESRETHMLSYGSARNSLVGELLKDAAVHEAGHYAEIGRGFDALERGLPRGAAPQLARLRVAIAFWDGWIDARDRQWQGGGNIDRGDWPMLARRIASELAQDQEISDPRVGARFDTSAGGPTKDPAPALSARLRAG